MRLIMEIKPTEQKRRYYAEHWKMDERWIAAAMEAETERIYEVTDINGKYIPYGYTIRVMNEGVQDSVKVYYNDELLCTAKTIPAAKRMLIRKMALPEGYCIHNPGGGFYVRLLVNGVMRGWLKNGDEFIKGYTELEAKTNLLKYLSSRML